MATIEGPIRFSGSLGNIRSYYDKDLKKWICSTKGGANKNLIKNNRAFARTRENNEEWKGCNIWSKLIRSGTFDLSHLKQGRNNYRLLKIAKQLQLMDQEGSRGKRSIESSKYNFPLIGFSMSNAHPFKEVFFGIPDLSITDDRSAATLRLNNIITNRMFSWPERIGYYRVYLTIAEIPDVVWNEAEKEYTTTTPSFKRMHATNVSEWMPINTELADVQIITNFPDGFVPREKTTVIAAMGIELASSLQYNTPVIVKDCGTMAIVGCF